MRVRVGALSGGLPPLHCGCGISHGVYCLRALLRGDVHAACAGEELQEAASSVGSTPRVMILPLDSPPS
jgi:hypothetical protein